MVARFLRRAMVGPGALALITVILGSDSTARAEEPPAPVEFIQHTDPGFGFELKVPAGWTYNRSRFHEFKDSIGLLRGTSPDGRQGLKILVFRSFEQEPFGDDWVIAFGKALAELTNAERVDWETVNLPPRAGAVLTYTAGIGPLATRSHCLCLPFDPYTVWVLIYTGRAHSAEDEAYLRTTFQRMIETLHVLYDPVEVERMAPALERGRAVIEKLKDRARDIEIDDQEHTYEILVKGAGLGYLRRRIARSEQELGGGSRKRFTKSGIRLGERSWHFASDGSAQFSFIDAFSGDDLRTEQMTYQQVLFPPPGGEQPQRFTRTDDVIREDDALYASYTTSLDRTLPAPSQPISVGPVYLDAAWMRLLPLLLKDAPQQAHAFVVYDVGTRALLTHSVTPRGRQKLPGTGAPALLFEIRTGFIVEPSRMYTDARGNLLRLEMGDLVIQQVPPALLESKYGPQREETKARFQQAGEKPRR